MRGAGEEFGFGKADADLRAAVPKLKLGKFYRAKPRAALWACSHYFCKMRCESKRSCARRETQPGSTPGQASQRGAWPFWPQPEGNGVKTAPLVVTLLAQAASLGVVARLDWRCFNGVRTCKSSVNRPYA